MSPGVEMTVESWIRVKGRSMEPGMHVSLATTMVTKSGQNFDNPKDHSKSNNVVKPDGTMYYDLEPEAFTPDGMEAMEGTVKAWFYKSGDVTKEPLGPDSYHVFDIPLPL